MSGDRAFVEKLLEWHATGHGVTLITVARTWGASPRPPGSLMAVRDDGVTAGSVSGGCVEEDLLARLRAGEVSLHLPTRLAYGTTRAEAARFGLPCGGRMELVIERVHEESLLAVRAALDAGLACVRRLHLASGEVQVLTPRARAGQSLAAGACADRSFDRPGNGLAEPCATAPSRDFYCDDQVLERRFGTRWRLLLIGANDLARHLVHCAAHLDYEMVICDPRAEVRAAWDIPGIVLDARMPDDVAAAHRDDERTAVVTLTHDPRIDDLALMEALTGRAFYVGALGSPRTSARRRERLHALGLPPNAIARLHAPVGLAIGSRTPPEIAIAILAGVTAVRRGLEKSVTSLPERVA